MKKTAKSESEVFNELKVLCSSKGFLNVISYFCVRDNMIKVNWFLKAEDLAHTYSNEQIIRTEMATLIGLTLQNEISLDNIKDKTLEEYVKKTENLLEKLHYAMYSIDEIFNIEKIGDKDFNPFQSGNVLRESIFYGGDSAYDFQFKDLSLYKYKKDEEWFIKNKGFNLTQIEIIINSIEKIQLKKVKKLQNEKNDDYTSVFIFTIDELVNISKLDFDIVKKIIDSFTTPKDVSMNCFNNLDDFNPINAYPVIKVGENKYILFQTYSLVQALYETPFFWFNADKDYKNTAMKHRGDFTEDFSEERLKLVFGEKNVFKNIDIYDGKSKKAGEIDVLVIYSNRAIILQAKSKKMTISAKKGNDNCLKDDFKKAIQDSYNQGYSCSKLLQNSNYKLVDSNNSELKINRSYKEIYIFCIISDHYPSLSFQTEQFLNYKSDNKIMPPFVMDVFLLDIMTEMLDSPLYFLSYINRRTNYSSKIMSSHELVILSTHLKQNLWLSNEHDMMFLGDDLISDLDVAMLSRRKGASGLRTPKGILTKLKNTYIGNLIDNISDSEDKSVIDFGFLLLSLSEDSLQKLNISIENMTKLANMDQKNHDMTMALGNNETGLTIHCNEILDSQAMELLEKHATIRKYSTKAKTWFAVCINSNGELRFGINLEYDVVNSKEMDSIIETMPRQVDMEDKSIKNFFDKPLKVKRNDRCTCGSGKKYKKCCL